MIEKNLKKEVALLIATVDKTHRYSMSHIYQLSNSVFNKTEAPQSCASCLIRKVKELRNWLDSQDREQEPAEVKPISKTRKPTKRK